MGWMDRRFGKSGLCQDAVKLTVKMCPPVPKTHYVSKFSVVNEHMLSVLA